MYNITYVPPSKMKLVLKISILSVSFEIMSGQISFGLSETISNGLPSSSHGIESSTTIFLHLPHQNNLQIYFPDGLTSGLCSLPPGLFSEYIRLQGRHSSRPSDDKQKL